MSSDNIFSNLFVKILRKFFALPEIENPNIGNPKRVIIIRQHNQFGDLLASVSLFRAVKEKYPDCHLTVFVSPQNYYAVTKNKFIDKYFIYNQKKLISPLYLVDLFRLLAKEYDLAVVPATVSISKTSCLLGRLANARYRVGPNSLNGKPNSLNFLFNVRVNLNWQKYPDAHISDFGLDILRAVGITTKNYRSSISVDKADLENAKNFLISLGANNNSRIIGLHVGAGKPPNRWSLDKFVKLIKLLSDDYHCLFYITGSKNDQNELTYLRKNSEVSTGYFLNKTIPEVAALISISDLFITNDTGVMHVAGTTDTPLISIFGPTNPFNWAPLGANKYFVRKSDLIDDVTVNDVYSLCTLILGEENIKKGKNADE